jgi:hypothetical protein
MTIRKQSQLLATLLVFGIGISRSTGCTRSAQAQRIEEVLFGLKIKRAGKIIVSTVWIHPYEQINGWREIADIRVAPRIAQIDRAHIVCREEQQPSIQRTRGMRSSHVGFSAVASSKGEGFMSLYISKPRTPKRRKRPKAGPQYRGAVSAVHLKGTPGA